MIEGDLLAGALAFAQKVADDAAAAARCATCKIDYPNAEAFLQFARNTVARDGEELSRRR